jgi:hypothetical protein
VEEAKASPELRAEDLWADVYFNGTEPLYMRGREREEVRLLFYFHVKEAADGCCKPGFLQ